MKILVRYLFYIIISSVFFFTQEVIFINKKINAEQFEIENFKEALKYSDAQIWDKAYIYAKNSNSDLAIDLTNWLRLRAGDAIFSDYINFIETKPKWPGMPYLIKQAEKKITLDEDPKLIIDLFKNNFPLTGHGSTMLSLAHLKVGDIKQAEKIAAISWLDQKFDEKNFQLMIKNFKNVISINNNKRLNNLLWKRDLSSVNQLKKIMTASDFFIAEQRVRLQKLTKSKDKIDTLKIFNIKDPGVLFDYANYLQSKRKYKKVSNIIFNLSKNPVKLGLSYKWSELRIYHARRELRIGNLMKAYKISSNHLISNEFFVNDDFKESKQGYVELEWLSGFIALNFLKKPEVAIKHFSNILDLVTNKNFLSKNYYWYARSLEKLERINEAQDYYKKGSIYISTFYGQLSAERINKNSLNLSEIEDRKYDCKKVNLLENSIINLGKKLLDADRLVLGVRFFKHAAETLLDEERKCLLVFLDRIGNLSGIIAISNKFRIKSDLILKYSFPLINNLDMNQIDNLQLVYSIIRQESGFYSSAISRTGALGLMQVMPATAKQVTSDLGIKYNKKRLSSDEIYNIKIGSFYFNKLLKKFKGSIVLSTAAYNAGPGTINRWLNNYGDPRKFGVDPLIWIEMIPYYETRNYVKRVLSNDLIYRHKLGDNIINFDRARKNFGHKF